MTALIVAVKGGYTEVVKELLKRNPNANMMDKDGNTALAIAAKEGHIEIVQDLLDAGSYVNITDRVRRQLMQKRFSSVKCTVCKVNFARLLLFSLVVKSGETMLIGAVRGGHVEIVRALLNKYADIDVRGQVGAAFFSASHTLRRPSFVFTLGCNSVTST